MRKKDAYLAMLIGLASQDDPTEQDVTLMVNGLLVSGYIISVEKWREHHHTLDAIGKALDADAELTEAEAECPPPNFIHLRNSQIRTPGQSPIPADEDGVFVRIPLLAVDGFLMGRIREVPVQG